MGYNCRHQRENNHRYTCREGVSADKCLRKKIESVNTEMEVEMDRSHKSAQGVLKTINGLDEAPFRFFSAETSQSLVGFAG